MDGPKSSELKIDWGDGVSAIDRTMRAIVLMIGEAIEVLVRGGTDRDDITIESDPDGVTLPAYVLLKGKRVFEVGFAPGVDGLVQIDGHWIGDAGPKKKRSVWDIIRGRK